MGPRLKAADETEVARVQPLIKSPQLSRQVSHGGFFDVVVAERYATIPPILCQTIQPLI